METKYYPTKAQRPINSKMNCEKINSVFNINPVNWKGSLIELIDVNT